MQSLCANCNKPDPRSKCSRCLITYCDRDCQLKHWTVHKQTCKSAEQKSAELSALITDLFSKIIHLIAGNIIILNAWYRKERGLVEIEVTETLGDLASPGTHFLHLSYKDLSGEISGGENTGDTSRSDKIQSSTVQDKYSELDKCYVRFVLKNYNYETFVPIRLSAPAVRAKQPQPSRDWSLMFDF